MWASGRVIHTATVRLATMATNPATINATRTACSTPPVMASCRSLVAPGIMEVIMPPMWACTARTATPRKAIEAAAMITTQATR